MKHWKKSFRLAGATTAVLAVSGLTSCISDTPLTEWGKERGQPEVAPLGEAPAAPAAAPANGPTDGTDSPRRPAPAPQPRYDHEPSWMEIVEASEPEPPRLIRPTVDVVAADGEVTLWLVDEATGDRVQRLLSKDSQEMEAEFSEDKEWILVSDRAFSDLQTVHLFKRSGSASYCKIDRDAFTGMLWDQFAREKIKPEFTITRYATSLAGWDNDALKLKLAALPLGGNWIEAEYTVELGSL